MKNFLLLIAISVLIISCGNGGKNNTVAAAGDSVAVQQPTVYEHEYLVKVGDVAPDFTLPLTNGGEFSLSAQRGKVVMLQFTASWCGICRREMPHIEQRMTKPVVSYIAGRTAPPGKRMGHAGAIIQGNTGTVASKTEALNSAGVEVAKMPSEIVDLLKKEI